MNQKSPDGEVSQTCYDDGLYRFWAKRGSGSFLDKPTSDSVRAIKTALGLPLSLPIGVAEGFGSKRRTPQPEEAATRSDHRTPQCHDKENDNKEVFQVPI